MQFDDTPLFIGPYCCKHHLQYNQLMFTALQVKLHIISVTKITLPLDTHAHTLIQLTVYTSQLTCVRTAGILISTRVLMTFSRSTSAPQQPHLIRCTEAAAPLLFRPGNPALCESRPLVTHCRLEDLLCFVFMSAYRMFDMSVYYLFLQYFNTVGWVF